MEYNTFTKEVHALILGRGRTYFNEGAVRHLTETSDGWTAEVVGQETYHVVITGAMLPQNGTAIVLMTTDLSANMSRRCCLQFGTEGVLTKKSECQDQIARQILYLTAPLIDI